MFHTLEATWDQSARRRWTALASLTMQGLGLCVLLLIPLLSVQGPPQPWTQFVDHLLAPPAAAAPSRPLSSGRRRETHASEVRGEQLLEPPTIPRGVRPVNDADAPVAPDFNSIGVQGGTNRSRTGIPGSIGDSIAVALPPAQPLPTHPIRVSHWAEGNVIYRVQPMYPLLARQARIQGSVQLRAIISKAGTIENLTVLSGHVMLVTAAVEAVKRWRYRPYLLNGEPVEVETEITVNFLLSAN